MPFFAGAFDAGQGRVRVTYGGDVRDGIQEGGAGKSVMTWLIYMCKVHLYLEVEIVVAQQTDMGVNMPSRASTALDNEDVTAEDVEDELLAEAGEPADESGTEADAPIGESEDEK